MRTDSQTDELHDVRSVAIDPDLTPQEKKQQFLAQIGDSDHFMVGDIEVQCQYGSMDIQKILTDMICG